MSVPETAFCSCNVNFILFSWIGHGLFISRDLINISSFFFPLCVCGRRNGIDLISKQPNRGLNKRGVKIV